MTAEYDPAENARLGYETAIAECRRRLLQKRREDTLDLAVRTVVANWKGCWVDGGVPAPEFVDEVTAEFNRAVANSVGEGVVSSA